MNKKLFFLLFSIICILSFGDTNQSAFVSYRVDEIFPNKGFISRQQRIVIVTKGSTGGNGGVSPSYYEQKMEYSSVFVVTTNTGSFVVGKWLNGNLKPAGTTTNGKEELKVLINNRE